MARLSKVHMSSKPLAPISPARPTPPPKAAPKADLVATSAKAARSNLRGLMEADPDPELPRSFQTLHHTTPKLRGFDPQLSAATFGDDTVAFKFNEKDLEKDIDASGPPPKGQLLDSQGLKEDPTHMCCIAR